jgi:hypothetical protein
VHGYVSPAASPNRTGDNWTEGIGNIVEFSNLAPGRVTVTNTTCAQFYLRLVLRAGPPASTTDASVNDAPASDAPDSINAPDSADAPND